MPIIQNLVADQFGSHIGKYQGRLKVTQGKETLAQAPLLHLQTVTIANTGVSISADAIRACTEKGIPIHFMSGTGTPYAQIYSAGLTGTVTTRRAQLRQYYTAASLYLATAIATGKLENQAAYLRYAAKYRKETDPDTYQELRWLADEVRDHLAELDVWLEIGLREGSQIGELREQLLSIEGRAAQKYWQGIRELISPELAWPGRQGRGARDPFNSALNYGYGILYSRVHQAVILAGLDPYAGFIHADRPGKPSLVLDLIEEFRTPVVDRTLIGLINKGVPLKQNDQGFLTKETRHLLAMKIMGRLEKTEKYHDKRQPLRHIIQLQARQLATYLRQERDHYQPFIVKW